MGRQGFDSGSHEYVRGFLRGIQIRVDQLLASEQNTMITELIEANECGVALEMLVDMLVDRAATIDRLVFHDMKQLAKQMRMNDGLVERVRPLVRG